VTQFYNAWFHDGNALWDEVGVSTYGPPPGYIPGGPNPSYALDGCCPSGCGSAANNAMCATNVTPPLNQPIQKSYKDFNNDWPVNSWTISEAGIYTNAAYVRMLSKFCSPTTCSLATGLNKKDEATQGIIQTVYPQPSQEKVHIKLYHNRNEIKLYLYDVSGKLLISAASKDEVVTLDLTNFSTGIYFLKAESGNKTETKKLIKE
jgi:hypothetical protein